MKYFIASTFVWCSSGIGVLLTLFLFCVIKTKSLQSCQLFCKTVLIHSSALSHMLMSACLNAQAVMWMQSRFKCWHLIGWLYWTHNIFRPLTEWLLDLYTSTVSETSYTRHENRAEVLCICPDICCKKHKIGQFSVFVVFFYTPRGVPGPVIEKWVIIYKYLVKLNYLYTENRLKKTANGFADHHVSI